jgi:hypothetical protein
LKILMAAKLQSNFPPTDCRWYGNRKEKLDAKEKLMGLISWLVVGALAGVLARRIVPGSDPGRSIVTIILGMAGPPWEGSSLASSADPAPQTSTSGPYWWPRWVRSRCCTSTACSSAEPLEAETPDPLPEMTLETTRSVSVSWERFVSWVLNYPCSFSPPADMRRHARGLIGWA